MMKRQQSQWKSSTGFILASAGSAIVLVPCGNSHIWQGFMAAVPF